VNSAVTYSSFIRLFHSREWETTFYHSGPPATEPVRTVNNLRDVKKEVEGNIKEMTIRAWNPVSVLEVLATN